MTLNMKVKIKKETCIIWLEMFASINDFFPEILATWQHTFTQDYTHGDIRTHARTYRDTHMDMNTVRDKGDDYMQNSQSRFV